ncbi:exodeoxyribonuclease VII small subunit [Candidatus Saccharibacteria bacterium]|nr:exodeoxyribonuclease VII small subunit [Candidatus Saccharibacteria bacterium]
MKSSNLTDKSVVDLQAELDEIIAWFQTGEVNLDEVEQKYQQGLEIAKELKTRIAKIENNIHDIKESLDKDS